MTPRLAIIGPGRVGWAIARAAAAAGYEVSEIGGGGSDARERLATAVSAAALDRPDRVDAEIVFLTVPDGELSPLAATLRGATIAGLVHTAGALSASALGLSRAGSFHPLRSFAGPPRDVELRGYGVAIDATDEPLAADLRALAERLGMIALSIPADGRARYHAAAVLGANASLALVDLARRQLDALGVPPEVGGSVLAALMASVADNVARFGVDEALSGPIRRGDAATVQRNLDALDATDEQAAEAYRTLGAATLNVVERLADRPSVESLQRIEEVLRLRDA